MADVKVTALAAISGLTGDDLVMVIDDPGGSEANKKITMTNFVESTRSLLPEATVSAKGLLSSGDKTKLATGFERIKDANHFSMFTPDNITIEEQGDYNSGGKIWIKVSDTGFSAAFFIRGLAMAQYTWAQFKSDLLSNSPSAIFETSPASVTDCLRLDHNNVLVYDYTVPGFKLLTATTVQNPNYFLILHCNSGRVAFLSSPSLLRRAIELYPAPATLAAALTAARSEDRRQMNSVGFNNYDSTTIVLEETGTYNDSYIYIRAYDTGFSNAVFIRGTVTAQYTWAQFKTKVLADQPDATFTTSPDGVTDALRLAHNNVLVYDYSDSTFKIVSPTTITVDQYALVHCDSGKVARLTKSLELLRLSAINASASNSLAQIDMSSQVLPIVKSYLKGISPADNVTVIDRFTFMHCTDLHYNATNADANLAEAIEFIGNFDLNLVICSGDICDGTGGRTKATTLAEIEACVNRMLTSPVPAVIAIGNHDDNVNNAGSGWDAANSYTNAINQTDRYTNIISPLATEWADIQAVENKCYHYIDFADDKIRVIVLDAVDVPIVDEGDGTLKYRVGWYYSQAQLDWLYTTLNSVPAGYGVILVNHGAAVTNYTIGTYLQGNDLIYAIIDAYTNGTSYSHTYTDSTYSGDLSTSKVFDFISAGAKEFICHIAGHTHTRDVLHPDNFADQVIIVSPNMYTAYPTTLYGSGVSPIFRDTTEELKNAFSIISVDRQTRKIYNTAFGAYRDINGNNTSRTLIIEY